MAKASIKAGDKVAWGASQGTVSGTVIKKQTSATKIKGHNVAASPDNPEYIVKTEKGDRAAHKASALHRE